jgi:hypothetical protein
LFREGVDAPDHPIGRRGQLPHFATLHFTIHLVETGAQRLVLPDRSMSWAMPMTSSVRDVLL